MRFRLTHQGELKASQNDALAGKRVPLAEHKHIIRRQFHHQMKRLWETNRFLREYRGHPQHYGFDVLNDGEARWGADPNEKQPLSKIVAELYRENGYRFVPLVRRDWSLLCSLNILFLRRDMPGSIISAGDLDNRVKTLIDCLRRPLGANELVGNQTPIAGEDPFYVLLEDDTLVTALAVDTDTLLDPIVVGETDQRRVHLIITVELKPYNITTFNQAFA